MFTRKGAQLEQLIPMLQVKHPTTQSFCESRSVPAFPCSTACSSKGIHRMPHERVAWLSLLIRLMFPLPRMQTTQIPPSMRKLNCNNMPPHLFGVSWYVPEQPVAGIFTHRLFGHTLAFQKETNMNLIFQIDVSQSLGPLTCSPIGPPPPIKAAQQGSGYGLCSS